MDGAVEFVKGDAIAGLIITGINLVAGIIIGMTMMGLTESNSALETYSILTVGDGLVALPSLLISIASGMLVTKARSDENIGQELPRQFLTKPKALLVASWHALRPRDRAGHALPALRFVGDHAAASTSR